MSRTEAADSRRALDALAAAWRVPCDPTQVGAMVAYADLLLAWSARINLTAARSVAAVIDEHLPDAFALARRLTGPERVVDIGSGGGLPAIPLALLCPWLQVDLCEPIGKKGAFLRTAIRDLGLTGRVRLHALRAEALAESHARQFDAAVSRATFEPTRWRDFAPRLVRPGGRFFALIAADALPDETNREVYFHGRRALVEIAVPPSASGAGGLRPPEPIVGGSEPSQGSEEK